MQLVFIIYISKDMARAPLKEPSLFLGLSIEICIYIYMHLEIYEKTTEVVQDYHSS